MSCKTILPNNLSEIINILDVLGCKRLELLKIDASKIKFLNDPLRVDKKFLNNLANNYESWFFKEFEKMDFRKLIKVSPTLYSKLGTVFAIKEVLRSFDIETKIKEWYEYDGKPYHFKIVIEEFNDNAIDKTFITRLIGLIDKVKNVRSVLEMIEIDLVAKSNFHTNTAINMEVELNKNLEVKWVHEDNKNFTGAISLDVNLAKDLELNFASNINQIGAVLWQV